ncbi:apolipoprotein D-like [Athalia rosae]|uniref:apolipoprotein D-like n=1 Tax=Athalia rosae TaxID=37344 RepID=UPI0020343C52|nr:apolipoprotein D-like [Athalia rosae]XP_048507007.1 apolipoprotein D-like [Athalia rosae]
MLWITLILFMVGGSMAQIPIIGLCPSVDTVSNFTVSRYVGKWYEAEKYFTIFQFGGKCTTAEYALSENGSVTIRNSQISSLTGLASSIDGIARFVGRSDDAKFSVNFPSLPLSVDAPYWVLDTDYDSYAVVWSCTDYGFISARYAWILTRERNPPLSVVQGAYNVLDKNGLSRAFLLRTDQNNCPESS